MEFKISKATIITLLLDGLAIEMTEGLQEPYSSLVSGGYANYQMKDNKWFVYKNWKTSYWQEPIIEPIESRFEILDIR